MSDITSYVSRLEMCKTKRLNFDSWWQDVADYALPRRDFNTVRTPGERRNFNVYDTTGRLALEMLATALHGTLTPPSSRWASLRIKGEQTAEVVQWQETVEDALFDTFSSPSSMFSTTCHEVYLDLCAFGTAVFMPVYRDGQIVFKYIPLNECWIDENDMGQIDTLYRVSKFKPYKLIELFGEGVHPKLRDMHDKGHNGDVEVLHVVEPRGKSYGAASIKDRKPFKSCYIDMTHSHVMREDGYNSFPYIVPRFSKRHGEIYGYCPGMDALPEIKTANQMQEVLFRAAAKNADPPILSPVDGAILPMRLDPGGQNFYNPDVGKPEFWSNNFQPQYLNALIQDKQALIRQLFYTDWIKLPDRTQPFTATETIQRAQDGMRLLGPLTSRMEAEFLSLVIQRVVAIKLDNQIIPIPPRAAQGRELVIEYTSPLAQAQRITASNSLLQGLNVALQLAQFDQSVLINLDAQTIFRDQAINTYNWPLRYLVDEDIVEETKAAQAEQQQQAAQLAQAEQLSKVVKNSGGGLGEIV